LVNEDDLKRVKREGLDVNARVCSLKMSGKTCYLANFTSVTYVLRRLINVYKLNGYQLLSVYQREKTNVLLIEDRI
jgi:hypothetical protein